MRRQTQTGFQSPHEYIEPMIESPKGLVFVKDEARRLRNALSLWREKTPINDTLERNKRIVRHLGLVDAFIRKESNQN